MITNRNKWSWQAEALALAVGALVLALLPAVFGDSYTRHMLIIIFIYALAAASWDVSLGYAGIFNFGHMALFGIGLYGYAILTKQLELNPWLAFGLAGLLSGAAAALMALPILRLKGIYIVLVTFGFSQLVMTLIVSQSDITGGTLGIVRIPTLPIAGHNLLRDGKFGHYYMALALLLLGLVALRLFVRSRAGLSVVALRDNEEYATSRGISLARQRLLTLVVSSLVAGYAGAFYGAYLRTAAVDVFGLSLTTLILSIVLLGGIGTIYGSVAAAALLVVASEILSDLGPWRPMLIAVLIMTVMLAYRGGLMGLLRSAWAMRRQPSAAGENAVARKPVET